MCSHFLRQSQPPSLLSGGADACALLPCSAQRTEAEIMNVLVYVTPMFAESVDPDVRPPSFSATNVPEVQMFGREGRAYLAELRKREPWLKDYRLAYYGLFPGEKSFWTPLEMPKLLRPAPGTLRIRAIYKTVPRKFLSCSPLSTLAARLRKENLFEVPPLILSIPACEVIKQ